MTFRILIECLEKFKLNQTATSLHSKTKVSYFESRIDEVLFEENHASVEILSAELKNLYSFDQNSNVYQLCGEINCLDDKDFPHNFWRSFDFVVDVRLLPSQTDECAQTVSYLVQTLYSHKSSSRDASFGNFEKAQFKTSTVRRFYVKIENPNFDKKSVQSLIDELSLEFKINSVIHLIRILDLKEEPNHQESNSIVSKEYPYPEFVNETYRLSDFNSIELEKLSTDLQLGLSTEDMLKIQEHYRIVDEIPTRIVLETLGQSWSEHCKHRIFNAAIDEIEEGVYKAHIKKATEEISAKYEEKHGKPFCFSVFKDNAGAVEFNENFLVTHKVETHNSPTALDPFGGAITGILGVNRDCLGFGLGAKPVMNTFGFCFPMPSNEIDYYRRKECQSPQLTNNYVIRGATKGVEVGGNCSGIPTVHGVINFDENYSAKPLVFCGTIGLIPKMINGRRSWEKKPEDGDLIFVVGGRTGRDGIHGAIFSSESLNEKSSISHVQIGAPITQKRMTDAILEARDAGLYNAITDNGAGGLSSSVGEMGESGFTVNLDEVLLKTRFIQPFEIWVSESQERMTLAVPERNQDAFKAIMKKHVVEFQVIGRFNNSGVGKISFSDKNKKTHMSVIDLDFLHNGAPQHKLQSKAPETRELTEDEISSLNSNTEAVKYILSTDHKMCSIDTTVYLPQKSSNASFNKNFEKIEERDLRDDIIMLLSVKNISSREEVITSYDHTVQGGSIVQPIQGKGKLCSDAGVSKPLLGERSAVAVSSAMHPSYGGQDADVYNMAAMAIDTAIRNVIVVGANPEKIALLDNFCWSNSFDEKRIWQLRRATLACYETAVGFGTPYISGKDSMFNDFKGFDENDSPVHLSDQPTLLISSIGIVDDSSICVTSDFKNADDLIYVIGETRSELGGSEYFKMIGCCGGYVPKVNPVETLKTYVAFSNLLKKRWIRSGISVQIGGIITAINRSVIGNLCGAKLNIKSVEGCKTIEQFLFSESSGRIVFSIKSDNQTNVENLLKDSNVIFQHLGEVTEASENITLSILGKQMTYSLHDALKSYYQKLLQ